MSLNDTAYLGYTAATGSEIDQDTYYLGVDIPVGRRLVFVDRCLKLTENSYTLEIVRATDGFTGGSLGLHSLLNDGGTDSVQSRLYGDVAPSGTLTVERRCIIEAGSNPGVASLPGTVTGDESLQSAVGSFLYRITRASGGNPYRLSLDIFCYELAER